MRWPPYQHVIFDCDSTLTSVEGIDLLANLTGKAWRVSVLTEAAMNGDVELDEIYGKRLRTLKPTRGQITSIRKAYRQNAVPDAAGVITALQSMGHEVYIISGGLEEPVVEFGVHLGVPRANIRAVGVEYDQLAGDWWQQNEDWPNTAERYLTHKQMSLTASDGKKAVVQELVGDKRGRSLLIGDGASDMLAGEAVNLFVGYGGVISRPRVESAAPAFIKSSSLAPLLGIAAGPSSLKGLEETDHEVVFRRAIDLISSGAIAFNDEQLGARFDKSFETAFGSTYPPIHPRSD